jgi:hypothetical protein
MSEALEKLFRAALEEVTVTPPERVWERVDAHFTAKRRRSRRLFAYGGTAAAGVLLLLSFFFFQNTREGAPDTELAQQVEIAPGATMLVTVTPPPAAPPVPARRQEGTRVEVVPPVTLAPAPQPGESLPNQAVALALDPMSARNVIPITSGSAYENAREYHQLIEREAPGAPRVLARNTRQEADKTTRRAQPASTRYTVSGYVAPGYASGEYSAEGTAFEESQMGGMYNLNGGVTFAVNAGKRLAVETGVGFSRIGQTADIKYHSSMSLSPTARSINTPWGSVSSPQALVVFNESNEEILEDVRTYQSGTLEQRLDAIDIPLHLRYYINNTRLKFSVLGGFGAHILVDNRTYLQSSDSRENIGAPEDIRSLNFSTRIGLGVEYPITHAIHFKLEPIFRYYLQSISSDSHFKPYSFNLSTGIGIRF